MNLATTPTTLDSTRLVLVLIHTLPCFSRAAASSNSLLQTTDPDTLPIRHSRTNNSDGFPEFATTKTIETWLIAFPDLKIEHEAFIAQGDRVVSQWSATGTYLGYFKGVEATGKKVSYTGVTIYRVVEGKIIDYWAYVNLHQLLDLSPDILCKAR